jgi:hypothetical protein
MKRAALLLVSLIFAAPVAAWVAWCTWPSRGRPGPDADSRPVTEPGGAAAESRTPIETDRQVAGFCGDCHAVPRADSFPRFAWLNEVEQGYEFYRQSRRVDLKPPPKEQVVAFFQDRAPEALAIPSPPDSPSPVLFHESPLTSDTGKEIPTISHLRWLALAPDQPPALWFCDMFSGEIGRLGLGSDGRSDRWAAQEVAASLNNPCHLEPCDLNGDGRADFVVADLGSFEPSDHHRGRVVWLHRAANQENWKVTVLRSGLGRVADVQPADVDGDGDTDLVVAEFGWRTTGRILLLRNVTTGPPESPAFELETIDSRHGTIHVPTADLDGDGRIDFVALVSQEHETIEAFLNAGDGAFRRQTIYAAPDPAFGSTGIELVDLDGDNDLDVLYTNGDALDSIIARPYHGVQWLENRGAFPFEYHHLAVLPGAARARAGDLDGDGLLDIVVAAFLPDEVLANSPDSDFDSLIWLRQGPRGVFARHRIEAGNLRHMTLELVDADKDGKLDIFCGNFVGRPAQRGPRITAFWNSGPAAP